MSEQAKMAKEMLMILLRSDLAFAHSAEQLNKLAFDLAESFFHNVRWREL